MDQSKKVLPTFSASKPVIYKKDYMREILKQYENHQNYEQAYKEYKDLISARSNSSPGPVVPFKEENVTEEQRTYKPNLALILLDSCKALLKNYSLAWREYIDCIKQHKTALQPTFSVSKPSVIYKMDYMREVLKQYENHQNYEQAYKEYKDLISARSSTSPGPVVPFKEENVTEEQRTYKPNLALILLEACMHRDKCSSLAWKEYTECLEKHKSSTTHMQKKNIDSSFGLSGERQGIDSMNQSSTFHPLQVIWDSDSDTEDSSMGKQTETTRSDQKQTEERELEVKQELDKLWVHSQFLFIETPNEPAIEDLLKNCQRYKDELQMGENLKGAVKEYETLLKKAKETGCKKQKSTPPPSKLSSVNDKEKNQAPLLYAVMADVSKKVPSYKRWREAVSEFIILTTLSQSEPKSSQKKRSNSQSGFQNKSKPPAKSYYNNIEKLLDQDWGPDRAPGPSVFNDYRHLFTCESVLRSTFPEADIFGLVDSTIRGPEDVPPELRHKALFHFLLSFNRKKYGVEPSDAWRDFGRLVLAEKQLELAKKAQGGPDFYKMQNELKEKTEEVEELSTRLSKYENKQLTEGNPNIADLSDTHRPTRLGEMYSQLFDDEWSEAFEAFKPKTDDEDDDIFPDTLYILQDLLTNIFEFCKNHSKCQKIYLEESFANAIALKSLKENFSRTPNERSKESVTVENEMNDPTNSSNKHHKLVTEDTTADSSVYEKTIASLKRDFRRAASSASVKNITELYIASELPTLIADETVRAEVRVLTYVRKCVELCWYFVSMQDPPMMIVSPKQGQLVDKTLFSFHGRRGKIVEVCVWPALLLHDNGPLVCKGYVLPEESNRHR